MWSEPKNCCTHRRVFCCRCCVPHFPCCTLLLVTIQRHCRAVARLKKVVLCTMVKISFIFLHLETACLHVTQRNSQNEWECPWQLSFFSFFAGISMWSWKRETKCCVKKPQSYLLDLNVHVVLKIWNREDFGPACLVAISMFVLSTSWTQPTTRAFIPCMFFHSGNGSEMAARFLASFRSFRK